MMLETHVRKNVSFTKQQVRRLAPLLQQHNGNFSLMMREVTDFTLFVIENCGSLSRAKELIYSQTTCNDLRLNDQIVMQVVKVIRRRK